MSNKFSPRTLLWGLCALVLLSQTQATPRAAIGASIDFTAPDTWTGLQTFTAGIAGTSSAPLLIVTTTGLSAKIQNSSPDTNGTGLNISVAATSATTTGQGGNATLSSASGCCSGDGGNGGTSTVQGAVGSGTGNGGAVNLTAGAGGATGNGGQINITSGAGGSTSGNSGAITIKSGAVTSGTVAAVNIQASNNGVTNIGTGTTTANVNVGNTSNTINLAAGTLQAKGTAGVTCSGTPTSSFATVNGIVTHC